MKKILTAIFCTTLLMSSCGDIKNSTEYKTMQAQRDSLMQVSAKANTELTEMMDIIGEVESNFSQIREVEKFLTVESQNTNEMTRDTKTRVRDNFNMINQIIEKNKKDIARLNSKLKNSSADVGGLRQTIERLNQELEDRTTTINDLKTSLEKRDQHIAVLETNVKTLSDNVEELASKSRSQETTIHEQDMELNAGYYIFGTSGELKEAGVIESRFLASSKVKKEGLDKSKFIRIDVRSKTVISVFSKKAKLITEHPQDSYIIEKDDKGLAVVKITDHTKFWSLSRFLIIEV